MQLLGVSTQEEDEQLAISPSSPHRACAPGREGVVTYPTQRIGEGEGIIVLQRIEVLLEGEELIDDDTLSFTGAHLQFMTAVLGDSRTAVTSGDGSPGDDG